jgi:uncharacterized membrane protein
MFYGLLKATHVLSIIAWLGGMMFVAFFLRPALAGLEVPTRLKFMHDVLGRFFKAVLALSLAAVISGFWMMGRVAKQSVQSGGQLNAPLEWWVMAALGVAMFAIFGHIRFALYKRLSNAVAASDWPAGGAALLAIRQWVTINLCLGVVIVLVVLVGLPK